MSELCTVDGCERVANRKASQLCETHYYCRRRTGCTDDPTYSERCVSSHGYFTILSPGHPLADKGGRVYEHRLVLFGILGGGEHPCFWCEKLVRWGVRGRSALVVDHLDGKTTNNHLNNLVASCNPCNSSRGIFLKWVSRHANDPALDTFLRAQLGETNAERLKAIVSKVRAKEKSLDGLTMAALAARYAS